MNDFGVVAVRVVCRAPCHVVVHRNLFQMILTFCARCNLCQNYSSASFFHLLALPRLPGRYLQRPILSEAHFVDPSLPYAGKIRAYLPHFYSYLVSISTYVLFVEFNDFYLRNTDSKAGDMSLIVF